MKKRKLNQNIIRVGDTVKITNPEIVIRIGYPMSFNDACEEVKKLYHNEIIEFVSKTVGKREDTSFYKTFMKICINEKEYVKTKLYRKIINALAYEHIQIKGFGGKERKLYTEIRQDLLGITAEVQKIYIKQTGTYFPPSGGYDYFGEYDFESGGLSNIKTHKILELNYWYSNELTLNLSNYIQIEAKNVEKIKE